jgi:hypothetical protein
MIINHYFEGFLRLKSWGFASMLGLANMSGTWDPMWTGPNIDFCVVMGRQVYCNDMCGQTLNQY